MIKSLLKKGFISLILIFISLICYAQQDVPLYVSGVVRDSITNEPLPYINVYFEETTDGALTSENGTFSFTTNSDKRTLVIYMIGYEKKTIKIKKGVQSQYFKNIYLKPISYNLNEIVIKPKKQKYSKKNNPAVDFVTEMIKNKNLSSPENKDYYYYEHYEKISMALENFTKENNQRLNNNNFDFIFNYVDTSNITGKPMLVVSFKETLEDVYHRKDPASEKHFIKATKRDGIDELLPQESVQTLLNEMFHEINIFDDKITLLTNQFVSPLSSTGLNFYKYFLLDTIKIDGKDYAKLGFVPFNSESLGFTGILQVALDSTKFVHSAELNVPKDINLNFVNSMSIIQEFNKLEDGTRIISKDEISVDFCVTSKAQAIFANRVNTYKKHSFEKISDSIFAQPENITIAEDATKKDNDYWFENRHDTIKERENNVQNIMSDLRQVKSFQYTEKILRILINGYIPLEGENSRFELGPYNTIYSSNKLEGSRFRLGGVTTVDLSKQWFFSGYLAYGLRDEKFKYRGQIEYSFKPKKENYNEFPINSLKAVYQYDTDEFGKHYLNSNKDNMFMSIRRLDDNRIAYQRKAELTYKREHYNNFSYELTSRYYTEYDSPLISFQEKKGFFYENRNSYSLSELELKLRYAPGEKFYQARQNRYPVSYDYSTFTLSHTISQRDVFGSDYSSNLTEGSFKRRFWISIFGYSDILIKAGKQWNKVPFTLLCLPNTNMTYLVQSETYYLMNTLEFMYDQYASIDIKYNLNGLILNRIPLIKKLKLREMVSFRALKTSLSDKNNPNKNPDDGDLFLFPEGTYVMGNKPYMELGVGLENIFKMLQIQYVWRLSYRGHENIDHSGLRFWFHISF